MKTLTNWTAKRAGGRITINAVNEETGRVMKVVGVDKIEGPTGDAKVVIATDLHGVEYRLA